MRLNELFYQSMELNNDVKEVLSEYPYLAYRLTDRDDGLEIVFSQDITSVDYIKNILHNFRLVVLHDKPVRLKVIGKKRIEKFQEYNGKIVIGNIEEITIRGFNIFDLKAKVDTGATTSSLHCEKIDIDQKNKRVKFVVLDKKHKDNYTGRTIDMPMVEMVVVRSSNGEDEKRPVVKTRMEIKDKKLDVYLTLSNRNNMKFPLLLGNDIIGGTFVVDPTIS